MNAFKKIIALSLAMMIGFMASTAPCFADGGDSYNSSNGQILFPSITVGNTIYTNVVITVGSIVSVGGSSPVCTAPQVLANGVCVTPSYVSQGGLTWMPVSSTVYTYAQATALCAGTINGQTGWRLPTQPELSALYSAYPNNSSVLTGQGWTLTYTWSSTPYSAGSHYVVILDGGVVIWTVDPATLVVTCVR